MVDVPTGSQHLGPGMKQTDEQTLDQFREQCRRQMDRPLALRLKYGSS